ncbi:MAG: type I-C CRISPR-associated protein Cas8c/Csd1 [Akkermansiaceae bacterium]|nr:type I-C CRISPR-associated protein Cas8c/Csd1 [Akkermansiaceae bacterium]
MILKELCDLYDRLVDAGTEGVPLRGKSRQLVSFRIVLNPDGLLVRIEDARSCIRSEKKTKKGLTVTPQMQATPQLLIGKAKPPAKLKPCFLWDNAKYLLGYTPPLNQKAQENPEQMKKHAKQVLDNLASFAELRRKHLAVEARINHPSYSAVCRFLESWDPAELAAHVGDESILSHNGVFQIQGEPCDVHDIEAIVQWWEEEGEKHWWGSSSASGDEQGTCLVTNKRATIARLHEPAIKGVPGARTPVVKLVSFELQPFESYGLKQGRNAPVSEKAAFAYCNALNYLLASETNHVRLGETTGVVFWTAAPRQCASETELLAKMGIDGLENASSGKAQDPALLKRLANSLRFIAQGQKPANRFEGKMLETPFFILGLSPNAARLSVRFYRESTFGDFLNRLGAHYAAMRLQHRGEDPEFISPFRILRESVLDMKNLPARASGDLLRAIIGGTPYPEALAAAVIRRFKADGHISYIRCAFLKAWLIRNHKIDIRPMLDTTNTQPGYLLGRLFAALVKTQKDALPDLKRTLRDSFYSSASSTPRSVFPRLLRLYPHHLGKLEGGLKVNRDRLVQDIMEGLSSEFPAHLDLAAQGSFALGYYHQTQAFYRNGQEGDQSPHEQQELQLN